MRFHIPFTIVNIDQLKRKSKFLIVKSKRKKESKIEQYLKNADIDMTEEEYRSIKTRAFLISFLVIYLFSTTLLILFNIAGSFLISFALSLIFSMFIFFSQTVYPKIYDSRRVKNIERNLIPALQDILVQLNSGIPLFNIIVNISSTDYGELSHEFKKAAKKINAGFPEMEVLEDLGEKNSSVYFKRTLWQISNGMRAGSNIAIIIKESIKSLNEEQILQIQTYGNKLNPLIMFYLIISVIMPALSITFLTIIASMLGLKEGITISMFLGVFIFVVLMQVMFLGTIKSVRPSLL